MRTSSGASAFNKFWNTRVFWNENRFIGSFSRDDLSEQIKNKVVCSKSWWISEKLNKRDCFIYERLRCLVILLKVH